MTAYKHSRHALLCVVCVCVRVGRNGGELYHSPIYMMHENI